MYQPPRTLLAIASVIALASVAAPAAQADPLIGGCEFPKGGLPDCDTSPLNGRVDALVGKGGGAIVKIGEENDPANCHILGSGHCI